jgi:hypothetical protein
MPRLIDHGLTDGNKKAKGKSEEPGPKPEGKKGRPTKYTEAVADEICRRLAQNESLREICKSPHLPPESTVRGWTIDQDHPFSARYVRAREIAFYSMEEEILEIADDATNDFIQRQAEEGAEPKVVVDHDHISRSRLRIEARKWLLSKRMPKVFGDKVELSGNTDAPLIPAINVTINRSQSGAS